MCFLRPPFGAMVETSYFWNVGKLLSTRLHCATTKKTAMFFCKVVPFLKYSTIKCYSRRSGGTTPHIIPSALKTEWIDKRYVRSNPGEDRVPTTHGTECSVGTRKWYVAGLCSVLWTRLGAASNCMVLVTYFHHTVTASLRCDGLPGSRSSSWCQLFYVISIISHIFFIILNVFLCISFAVGRSQVGPVTDAVLRMPHARLMPVLNTTSYHLLRFQATTRMGNGLY
jgi:hypothetical protein